MNLNKITLFLISASIFAVILIVGWSLVFKSPSGTNINTNRAAVIKEIRNLQRHKILLIAHGQVIAGFDLSQMSNDIAKAPNLS